MGKRSRMTSTPGMDGKEFDGRHNKRTKFEHLKPLSVYARMGTCNQVSGLQPRTSPFINMESEAMNGSKRDAWKFDDSCPDEGYDTPAKKLCSLETFSPQGLSPDLGCFMDYRSPLTRQDFASPFVFSKPAQKTQAMRCDIKQTVSSPLQPQQVGSRPSTKPEALRVTMLNRLNCKKLPSKVAPALDSYVNTLGPLAAGKLSEEHDKENCSSPGSSGYQKRPNLKVTVQVSGRRDGQVEKEELKKHMNLKVKEDEEVRDQQAALTGLSDISNTPLPESADSSLNILEADIEQEWAIGLPIFESTVCHNVDAGLNDSVEKQSKQPMAPVQECQTTIGGEETSMVSSYDSSLPLQVQVKSVVVVLPNQCPPSSKPAPCPLPELSAQPIEPSPKESKDSQTARTVVSQRVEDMERNKQIYMEAVNQHLQEKQKPTGGEDVMAELRTLMANVAQTLGVDDSEWQHPSDLSRRNYQRRFGNMIPALTLDDWQDKNQKSYKRFANVPKIFQRSQSA